MKESKESKAQNIIEKNMLLNILPIIIIIILQPSFRFLMNVWRDVKFHM